MNQVYSNDNCQIEEILPTKVKASYILEFIAGIFMMVLRKPIFWAVFAITIAGLEYFKYFFSGNIFSGLLNTILKLDWMAEIIEYFIFGSIFFFVTLACTAIICNDIENNSFNNANTAIKTIFAIPKGLYTAILFLIPQAIIIVIGMLIFYLCLGVFGFLDKMEFSYYDIINMNLSELDNYFSDQSGHMYSEVRNSIYVTTIISVILEAISLMTFCFVPYLIVINRISALKAITKSISAFIKNIPLFILSPIALIIVLMILAFAIPFGLLVYKIFLAIYIYNAYKEIFKSEKYQD